MHSPILQETQTEPGAPTETTLSVMPSYTNPQSDNALKRPTRHGEPKLASLVALPSRSATVTVTDCMHALDPSQSSRLKSSVRQDSSTSAELSTQSMDAATDVLPLHSTSSLDEAIFPEFDTIHAIDNADMTLGTFNVSLETWDGILTSTWDEPQSPRNLSAFQLLDFASPLARADLSSENLPAPEAPNETFSIDPQFAPLLLPFSSQHQPGQTLLSASPSLDFGLESLGHVPELTSETFKNLSTWACTTSPSWDPSVTRPLNALSASAFNTLNAFIQLYFEEFHDILPIIHRPTFDPNFAPYLLVLAVGNIGRRFSKLAGQTCFGIEVEQFVYHAVQHQVGNLPTNGTIPVWLAQTVLLTQVSTTFSNDKHNTERSKVTRSILAVTLGRLEPLLEAADMNISENRDRLGNQVQWETWIEWEVLRRTAFGLWLLDSQCSLLFDLTPVVPMEAPALQMPLPCHERLWEKSSASSWAKGCGEIDDLPTLRQVMQSLYKLGPLPENIGGFTLLLLLFCFFRDNMFLKQVESRGFVAVLNTDEERITSGTSLWSQTWQRLDPTNRSDPTRMRTVSVQYYHLIGLVTELPLKDLNAFVGWRVTRSKQRETRQKLMAWVAEHGGRARSAAHHAGRVFRQCRDRSSCGYQAPFAMLIASLTLWMYNSSLTARLLSCRESYYHEENQFPTFRLDEESDREEASEWIQTGKRARPLVAGIGDIHKPGGHSKAVNQAISILSSLKEWRIGHLISINLKDLIATFDKDTMN
ncbi:fungal transcription factor [Colletotrichum acutatum]